MKKFLLLFISILSLSLFINTNKTYAQEYPSEQYPSHLMKASYSPYVLYPIAENEYTYEYELYYTVNALIYDINEIDYYLFSEEINFKKGIDRFTNSYQINRLSQFPDFGRTAIYIHVTLSKHVVEEYHGDYDPLDPTPLFRYYSVLYVTYFSDTGSIDYDSGYQHGYDDGRDDGYDDGYNVGYNIGYNSGYNQGHHNGFGEGFDLGYDDGYNTGYDIGYTDGINATQEEAYQQGYEDGRKSTLGAFTENFHIWIIPAIIIVFAIGVFISYRKGRE